MLFYKNYIVYYNVYCYFCGVFIEKNEYTKFHIVTVSVSYMAIYVPIVMYGPRLFIVLESLVSVISSSFVCLHLHVFKIRYCLRLFIVILQELHCLPNCLHVCMIRVRGWYHITKFCYSTPSGF